jgi:hypothetical protein
MKSTFTIAKLTMCLLLCFEFTLAQTMYEIPSDSLYIENATHNEQNTNCSFSEITNTRFCTFNQVLLRFPDVSHIPMSIVAKSIDGKQLIDGQVVNNFVVFTLPQNQHWRIIVANNCIYELLQRQRT